MSFFEDVQIAFDKTLQSLADGLPVAWENVNYTPTQQDPWLRPTMLYAPATLLHVEGAQQNPGIYQIDLFYPPEKGAKAMLLKMGEIYEHFKANQSITQGDTSIFIREITRETPTGGQNGGLVVDGKLWFTGSLGINFNCYTS